MVELDDLIGFAAEEVLETMFYSAISGPGRESPQGPYVCARVTFAGTRSGAIEVSAPEPTAISLAAAFLGESPQAIPEGQAPAVIGELANVLCGVLLGRVEEGGYFVIAPPRVTRMDAPASGEFALRRVFELEEGTLAVGLSFDE